MAPAAVKQTQLPVLVVCCGEPKKGMGWFHLSQMLQDPRVVIHGVVDPWFLGPGADAPGAAKFSAFCEEVLKVHPNARLAPSVRELPSFESKEGQPLLALIAPRTCDSAKLFQEVIEYGATHVYLEKPGAESADQLELMGDMAMRHGAEVIVGYNKNVSRYVQDGLAELDKLASSGQSRQVTLEHNNDFQPGPELLDFLRGPAAEGMLRNMCCHELALAATFFGASVANVRGVTLEKEHSQLVELGGSKRDWQRVAFRIDLGGAQEDGNMQESRRLQELRFVADRCGGNFSCMHLQSADGSAGCSTHRLPRLEDAERVAQACAADPEMRPYFVQQGEDYERLRGSFIQHILEGRSGTPEGAVDLRAAVETLRLADLLVPVLQGCHDGETVWTASGSQS